MLVVWPLVFWNQMRTKNAHRDKISSKNGDFTTKDRNEMISKHLFLKTRLHETNMNRNRKKRAFHLDEIQSFSFCDTLNLWIWKRLLLKLVLSSYYTNAIFCNVSPYFFCQRNKLCTPIVIGGGRGQQTVAKWESWSTMETLKPTIFALKRYELTRVKTIDRWCKSLKVFADLFPASMFRSCKAVQTSLRLGRSKTVPVLRRAVRCLWTK